MQSQREVLLSWMFMLSTVMVVYARPQDPTVLREVKEHGACTGSCSPSLAVASPQDMPQVKKQVPPHYPELLQKAGIEGEVYLQATIDENGKVVSVKTAKSTNADFVEAAVEAVKKWEFSPALKDGKPIKAEVTIPFRFKLEEKQHEAKDGVQMQFKEDAYKILRGEPVENLKSQIGDKAIVVIGKRQEKLSALLSEKAKRDLLVEGPECKIEIARLVIGDSGDMACLVMKTNQPAKRGERWHTVIFKKSSEQKWTIMAWQAGE